MALLAILMLEEAGAGDTGAEWNAVRHRPIIDGESLAGIRLGDTVDGVTRVLGVPPGNVHYGNLKSRADYVYALRGPNNDWALMITVSLTIGSQQVEAVHMSMLRSDERMVPYVGVTKRGYRPGEPRTRLRSLYGSPDLADVIEVVTNSEGKFTIPARRFLLLSPFFRIQGPIMQIFRPGYVGWRFRGQPPSDGPMNIVDRDAWIAAAWQRFASPGEVIELDEARSLEDRNWALVIAAPIGPIPEDRIPRYRKALHEERARLRRARYGGL